jgi:type I restriction enzyme S subunit
MINNKLVPKRRFKEFKNDEAWEQRKFDLLFEPISSNTLSRADLNYENGKIKSVHYGDILIKYGSVIDCDKDIIPFITGAEASDYQSQILQDGDVLIADAAEDETVGKVAEIEGISEIPIVSGLHTIACRPRVKMQPNYLGYYMNSQLFHKQLLPLMQGIKVLSVSRTNLSKTTICYPTLAEEQSHIVKFFSNLDHLITLHQRKLKKLKDLKSAYLSEMFPKEGEKYPKLRFAGFTAPWEQRTLGEVANITGGGTPSTSIPGYWDGDIDWYSPVEIGDQIYVSVSQKKITELGLEKSSARMLPVGTILFTSRAGIGNTAILAKEGCTNQGFQSIVPHKDELDSYFIFSRTHELKHYGETIGAGSTFVEVSGKQMAKMSILLPSKEEQRKIGSFYEQLDNLITLHQHKLKKLEDIKKAYLNEMFV